MESRFKKITTVFTVVIMSLLSQVFATVDFDNEVSRFILKDSNSKIRLNPSTVYGWRDRSLIKNITDGGLGDYNLKSYSGADDIVTYAEASGELVYDNSNAIIKLDRDLRTDSNAFAYGITNNSNAIVLMDGQLDTIMTDTTDLGDRITNNSNAIVLIDGQLDTIMTDTTDLGTRITNNSNAIVLIDGQLDTIMTDTTDLGDRITNNSNAIVLIDGQLDTIMTDTTDLGTRITNNSNAIIALETIVRTDSNAFAYGIKNNSNAILAGSSTLAISNSNTIVSWIKNTSNSVISLDARETALETTVRTDSNAFAYGIKNNSNAILMGSSALAIENSNAIVTWVKNTSDAVIKLSWTSPLVDGDVNADVTMNQQLYLDSDQIVNITNPDGVVIDGQGQTIIFNNSSGPQFVVQENVPVILENITLANINQNTFNIHPGGQISIGANTTFEFTENVTFSTGTFNVLDSPDGTVCTFVSLSGNNVVTYNEEAILNLGDNTLRLENIELGSVTNIDYGANNLIELASDASVDIDGDTGEAIGLNFKAIGPDNALSLMTDNLTLSGLITFGDSVVNELAIRFVLENGLDPERVIAGEIYPIVNFSGGPGIRLGGSPTNVDRLVLENPYTIFNLVNSNAFLLDENGQIFFKELELRENNIKQYSANVLINGDKLIGYQIDPSFIRAYYGNQNRKQSTTSKPTSKVKAKIQVQPKTAKVKVEKSKVSDTPNVTPKLKSSPKNTKTNFKDKKLKIKYISAKNRKGVEALEDILGIENLDEDLSDNDFEALRSFDQDLEFMDIE
ncbi:MAG: hypothetical protein V1646_04085 [bacterium]